MAPSPRANFSAIRASMPASADGSDLLEPLHASAEPRRDRRRARTARPAPRAPRPPASAPAHFTAREQPPGWRWPTCSTEDEHERRQQRQHGHSVEQALEDDRGEGAGRAQPFLPREQIRANDLAGARRQHALAAKPTAVARNALPKLRRARAARAGTASAPRESPGSRASSPATAPSQSGRACDDLGDHAARDRRCAGTARASRPRGRARRMVRRCDRISAESASTITALRCRRGAPLHVVVVSRRSVLVRCNVFCRTRNSVAARLAHSRHHARPPSPRPHRARSATSTTSATGC